MNRKQRRAASARGERFVATCAMCKGEKEACEIHVLHRREIYRDDPTAPKDLGICKGCPCSSGKCDACGEVEGHWLGCKLVGLPDAPERAPSGVTLQ